MSEFTIADTSRHPAVEGDDSWQESFFLGWTDIRNKVCGHHHISLCPHLKLAHVWSWLIVDGVEVARSQENTIPLPDADLRDMRVGIVRILAGQSIRQVHFGVDFEGARVDVDYEGYSDPVHVEINTGGKLKLGSRHYESMGSVKGAVTIGDRVIAINGSGWHDHSWGSRRLGSNPAGRWVFAVFGPDLAFSLYVLYAAGQNFTFGYVLDGGVPDPIEAAETGFVIADDGLSPIGNDTVLWTRSGKAWRVTGRVLGTALVGGPGWSGDGFFWWMDGLTRFECGGRVGGGILEVSTLKAPTEEIQRILKAPGFAP